MVSNHLVHQTDQQFIINVLLHHQWCMIWLHNSHFLQHIMSVITFEWLSTTNTTSIGVNQFTFFKFYFFIHIILKLFIIYWIITDLISCHNNILISCWIIENFPVKMHGIFNISFHTFDNAMNFNVCGLLGNYENFQVQTFSLIFHRCIL